MIPVVIIGGPTASGKTALSLKLCSEIECEIVSADSMQIYRYMDIGSAKVSLKERSLVVHHMIDVVYPWQDFDVADYNKTASGIIRDIYYR
ncbi:MAG: isopentenyl transferase family protein, partial [Candidatus Muiribacteriaceae bacterium]